MQSFWKKRLFQSNQPKKWKSIENPSRLGKAFSRMLTSCSIIPAANHTPRKCRCFWRLWTRHYWWCGSSRKQDRISQRSPGNLTNSSKCRPCLNCRGWLSNIISFILSIQYVFLSIVFVTNKYLCRIYNWKLL